MEPRIDYRKYAKEAQGGMLAIEKYTAGCGLDHKLSLEPRGHRLASRSRSLQTRASRRE